MTLQPEGRTVFISLKWKLLVAVLIILTILGGILGGFAYRQLISQQNFLLESQRDKLAQNLETSISLSVDHSLSAAQQIALLVNGDQQTPSDYQAMLDLHWPDLQLYWELDRLSLLSLSGQVLAHAGKLIEKQELSWFESAGVKLEPHWRIVCLQECVIQVLVPNLLQGEPHFLFMETGLTDILARFRINETFELAVLAPSTDVEERQSYWGREVFSISNKHASLVQLEQAAEQFTWKQIENREGVYRVGGELSVL